MAGIKDRMANWIAELLVSGLLLFPGLVVAHCLAPRMFPWWIVLVPLVGGLHLAVSWMAAQMIARILLSLVPPSGK